MDGELETVIDALVAALPKLGATARAEGWKRTTERDLQRVLESASGMASASVTLEHWPQVGSVDLMFARRTAVELKWAKGGDTLANCAWDIAKLAALLAAGEVAVGVIVAGAPKQHWTTHSPGVELFEGNAFAGNDIVSRYERWWRFWCKDVLTRPIKLPRAYSVEPIETLSTKLDEEPFELKIAQVRLEDGTLFDHVCPHRSKGTLCRPRAWDPNGWGGLPPG